jgi:hypothetical protein
MGAALKIAFTATGSLQHALCHRNMFVLTRMGSTGKRQFCITKTESIGGATFNQRQGLNRLYGGTWIDGQGGIAQFHNGLAIAINNTNRAPVTGLDNRPSGDFNEYWIGQFVLRIICNKMPRISCPVENSEGF